MTRKELLELEARNPADALLNVESVILIPSARKGDAGYGEFDFVANIANQETPVRFGGVCDVVNFEGAHFKIDSDAKTRLIRVFNDEPFIVSPDGTVISFIESK